MSANGYIQIVKNLIARIEETQIPAIERVAKKISDSIAEGGVLHIFGSGHSHMIAEETFHRAGGLACINAMLEESLMEINAGGRATLLERLPGYAEVLLSGYDLRPGEVIIVISNSGMNAVPIEVAMECKRRGLFVVALTNLEHSRSVQSRHASGKKLYEVADEILDNCSVYGDAEQHIDGLEQKIGPTSSLGGIAVIQTLVSAICAELLSRGQVPPVFISSNRPGGDDHNVRLEEKYRNRVRYL